MSYEELYQAEHAGRLAAEAAWLEVQNQVNELATALAAEREKTARLLRQIRNREPGHGDQRRDGRRLGGGVQEPEATPDLAARRDGAGKAQRHTGHSRDRRIAQSGAKVGQ